MSKDEVSAMVNMDSLGTTPTKLELDRGDKRLANETWPILHSPRDQMTAIHPADYYDTYRLLAAYLAYLDVTLDLATDPKK
ncbi:MAG: hypothetical protein ABSG13_05855 [Bryobacteraceae bacterium]|jgi:hypothetical protein